MRREGKAGKRVLTAAAWATLFVFATTSALLSVSLRRIGSEFAVGLEQRGVLFSVRAFALALAALAAGWGADRIGKRWFLTGGMVLVGGALVWIGSAASYPSVLLATGLMALGLGPAEALTSPLVAELHRDDVPTQMSILHAFYPAGAVLPALLVGWLLDAGVQWRIPFQYAALPALVLALVFLVGRYPRPDVRATQRASARSFRRIMGRPVFWMLAAAMVLSAGCEGSLFYWMPNFVEREYGAGAVVGAGALTLYSAAMAAGRLGLGAATRRLPLSSLLVGLAAGGAAVSLGLALLPSLWVTFLLAGVAGLCVAAFWPGILSLAARRIGAGSATLFALLSVAGIAGFGLMPPIVGVVGERFGLRAGLCVVPGGFIGAALLLKVLFDREPA